MAGGSAGGGSVCTRARALKLLLALLGAVVFIEYIAGLRMDAARTVTLYAANATNNRNQQALQWPKRTHGRHCFDDHNSSERNQQMHSSPNNNTSSQNQESLQVPSVVLGKKDFIVNVHNATQRSKVFSDELLRPNKTLNSDISKGNIMLENISYAIENSSMPRLEVSEEPILGESHSKSPSSTPETTPEPGCDVPCPEIPPDLEGPIYVNVTEISLKDLETSHLDVEEGGRYAPRNCRPHDRVAIVIPYRDRESHLAIFLNNIHPFLMKQQIDYQIFIVEQKGNTKFNRASLMNVGFMEAMRLRPWDCFIFHDVDLLPLDDRNLYTCPHQPRHLSAAIDKFQFKLPYKTIFGGVSALTTEQFQDVNGFSNSFWGWGGEDDDMANRIVYHNYHISRYPMSIARYTMLDHEKEKPNQERYNLLMKGKHQFKTDGLNNLQYTLMETHLHRLYTQLLVELHPPS